MRTSRLNRQHRRGWAMRIGGGLALATLLALGGCGDDYVTDSQASVLLVVRSIEDGGPVLSDIVSENATIVNCDVVVEAEVVAKNPNSEPTRRDTVTVSSYHVKYTRSDGRDVQGLDVPYEISGPLTQTIDGNTSAEFPVTMVRHQAKLEAPLKNVTGTDVVTMGAEVTLYGETLNGDGVSASGSVQITFADFGDGTQTCETGG
jgi:hypothetical protein